MAEIAIAAALSLTDTVISLYQNRNSIGSKNGLHNISSWLATMKYYLKDAEGKERSEGMTYRVQQVRDIAYDIEDVLEEFMVLMNSHFHEHKITKAASRAKHSVVDHRRKSRFSSRIQDIENKIKNIKFMDEFRVRSSDDIPSSSRNIPPEVYPSVEDDELVGIEERCNDICDLITSGGPEVRVISVVGSRGSGKTTLLKQVCKRMKHHFQCADLVPAPYSQTNIYAALDIPFLSGNDEEFKHQKKFILFFDGIARKEDWNRIRSLLPDHSNGSRVLVSTHERDIASHICREKPCHQIYDIKALTAKESIALFSKKLFGNDGCPKYLIDYAERLLYKCEGLPLAIVAMSSLLSNKQRDPREFEKLYNSIGHELESSYDLSIFGSIVLQSYYRLSPNRRCCFLYLCNFPENYPVRRGRLIRLWIAEQFIEDVKGKTLEEMAEDYLHELIQLNLIYSCGRNSGGKVRSCQVHSLVREFILSKAEKENFSSVLEKSCEDNFSKKTRRLVFHDIVQLPNSFQVQHSTKIRTFAVFGRDGSLESSINRLIGNFRLLRVLDLQDVRPKDFPESVTSLVLLRYLSLRNTEVSSIPRSIRNLQNLVSLDLRQTRISKLHKKITKLENLVYLLADFQDASGVRKGVEVVPGIGRLKKLQKLSLVKANNNSHWMDLAKLAQLRKLEISDLNNEDGQNFCESIKNMEHLSSLTVTSEEFLDLDYMTTTPSRLIRSLHLDGRLLSVPQWISSLHGVVKISLRSSRLDSSPLENMKDLPYLSELQLVDAYNEEELEFKTGWFQQLRVLEIEKFHRLRMIVIQKGAISKLRKFIIRSCTNLRIAPLGIHNLANLEDGVLVYGMEPLQSTS